jgi:regulator of RNase E activity RraA
MDSSQIIESFRAFDAYTLGDAARRAMTGGVLRCLQPQTSVTTFVGRALTARVCYEQHKTVPLSEYGAAALRDRVQPGDVIVIDGGGLMMSAMGELAYANLARRGAAGAVLNACMRDAEQIDAMQLGLPVFALGTAIETVAGHARIIDIGEPVYIQGVRIASGDVLAGCRGGLVVLPWADHAAVLAEANTIARSDQQVMAGIERGESMSEIWRKYKSF